MIRSMTGFTRESGVYDWGTMILELSSVNHRYQEISPRLPRELASFEPVVTNRLRQGTGRGKMRCTVELHWAAQYRTASLDTELLSNYHEQLSELAATLGNSAPPSLDSLLTLPGVFDSPSRSDRLEEMIRTAMEELLDRAVVNLLEMREVEGANLLAAIEEYLASLGDLVDSLETAWTAKKEEVMNETRARIASLLEGVSLDVDQNRIAQEIVILSDKWDISEEFVRAKSHLGQFKTILNGKESEGRKLDFLLQEMNREVNTIGSKIADAELRWMVVEAKAILEKIREQVQNVE
ncbi:MAG: YicC family protein [Synergistaceae bacterium]|nr:YicC/YloC family endoribonuclease [Synergistota bacterium]NLM70928.1 YicC family protein [Synergistaceae bacterium]